MKRILLASLALAAALGIFATTRAEEWKHLGKHTLGHMYVNTDTAEVRGNKVTFWAKRIYDEKQTAPEADGAFQYREQHVKHVVDCVKQTVVYTDMRFYDDDNRLVQEFVGMHKGPQAIDKNGFVVKSADLLCPETKNVSKKPAKE